MVRTISQIAGDFGLAQNATQDPFAKTEEATLQNLQRQLSEMRSQSQELAAAQGVGRSTFQQGVQARQEEGIVGSVLQQLQGARLQEDLAQRAFERGIVGAGVQADLAEQAAQAGFGRQVGLLGTQADIATQAREQQASIASALTEQQAGVSERLAEQQGRLQADLAGTQSELQQQRQEQLFEQQEQLTQQQADIATQARAQQAGLTTQQMFEQEGIATRAREQAAGLTSQQLQQQAQIDRDRLAQQAGIESGLISDRSVAQIQAINQQFDNDINRLQEQIRLLPAEIDEKIRFSNETKLAELQLAKQNALDQVSIQAVGSFLFDLLGSSDVLSGLTDIF